ncbi:MAG: esterase [Comamonadaceae bacterium]|nr:MAG: esterase [Comamonadaceae bacterium]
MGPSRMWTVAALAMAMAGCGGGDGGDDGTSARGGLVEPPALVASFTAAQIDDLTAAAGTQVLTGKARCDVSLYGLNYRTVGVRGEPTNASGVLLLPAGACRTSAPLVAYSKGTDVVKPRTLANPADAETRFLVSMYAAQGYALVASDMLGFAKSSYGFHPYLHADSEASSNIDAIRAARRAARDLDRPLSGKLLLTGYSQGGHTSMATQRAIERDFPAEFDLVAGAHLAGPYNLSTVVRQDLAVAGSQVTLPYMVTAFQKVYGDIYGKPSDVFKAPYADTIADLLPSPTMTLATLVGSGAVPSGTPEMVKAALLRDDFRDSLRNDPRNPLYLNARKNDLLDWTPKAPMLMCGGSGDPTIPFAVHQETAATAFRARGYAGLTSVDVDPQVQAAFGIGGKAPQPGDAAYPVYVGSYHAQYAGAFCHPMARAFLDRFR